MIELGNKPRDRLQELLAAPLPPHFQWAHGRALEKTGLEYGDLWMVRRGREHQAQARANLAAQQRQPPK